MVRSGPPAGCSAPSIAIVAVDHDPQTVVLAFFPALDPNTAIGACERLSC